MVPATFMRFSYAFLCAVAIMLTLAPPALAEQVPLWEVGAGVAAIDFPEYRGSNVRTSYLLPIPYLVYRGDFLKIDRARARATFSQRQSRTGRQREWLGAGQEQQYATRHARS